MIYGYARVSTFLQMRDGHSLEHQENVLKEKGCQKIFKDTYSGTKKNRPQFDELLKIVQEGDVLIVTKLDRFARSSIHGAKIVEELLEKGVTIDILNLGIMDNTPSSKLIRSIFFGFAEFERDMIVERTQEGKEIAKTKEGYRDGRPPKFKEFNINNALNLLEEKSYKYVAQKTGISVSTLVRAKRKRKLKEEGL